MINAAILDGTEPVRILASKIRRVLSDRCIVTVTNFPGNQSTLVDLAGQLGTARRMSGASSTSPVIGQHRGNVPGQFWFESRRTIYQRIAGIDPVISLDYCIRSTGMIRWFTDLTETFKCYPKNMFDGLDKATATYSTGLETRKGPLLRKTRLGDLSYAAITDSLISVEGLDQDEVATMKTTMTNLYGQGIGEIYLDRPGDLVIHLSDGIGCGQMSDSDTAQGQWSYLTVDPDWDLIGG
jgi:hypothetical protein